VKVQDKLAACGADDIDPAEFREVVCDLHSILHPCLTVDQVLARPTECGVPFCETVRRRFAHKIPDEVILGELLNARKDGILN
jgi:hypothetical protein